MPGRNFLFIAGPTNVPERILNAMHISQEDMRAVDFPPFTIPLLQDVKKVFKTGQVVFISTSGTGGWGAGITNTLSPGDKVLAADNFIGGIRTIVCSPWAATTAPEPRMGTRSRLMRTRDSRNANIARYDDPIYVHRELSEVVASDLETLRTSAVDPEAGDSLLLLINEVLQEFTYGRVNEIIRPSLFNLRCDHIPTYGSVLINVSNVTFVISYSVSYTHPSYTIRVDNIDFCHTTPFDPPPGKACRYGAIYSVTLEDHLYEDNVLFRWLAPHLAENGGDVWKIASEKVRNVMPVELSDTGATVVLSRWFVEKKDGPKGIQTFVKDDQPYSTQLNVTTSEIFAIEFAHTAFNGDTTCADPGFDSQVCKVNPDGFRRKSEYSRSVVFSAAMVLFRGLRSPAVRLWITGNLTDPTGTGFRRYFLGSPDEEVPPSKLLIKGNSIENNADVFAAFMALVAIEKQLDNDTDAEEWMRRANVADDQIRLAQSSASFGDGRGLVASTLQDGDGLSPLEQCLSTLFQCIAERVGLAATIFAERNINPLGNAGSLSLSQASLADKNPEWIASNIEGWGLEDVNLNADQLIPRASAATDLKGAGTLFEWLSRLSSDKAGRDCSDYYRSYVGEECPKELIHHRRSAQHKVRRCGTVIAAHVNAQHNSISYMSDTAATAASFTDVGIRIYDNHV